MLLLIKTNDMEIVELNAKDFRLGNKLYYSKKIVDVDPTALITLNSSLKFGEGFNFYQPIPLIEEILLKCGFVKDENEMFVFNRKVIYKKNDNTFHFYSCNIEIKHLHQLQNLYFALTGQELEINL